MANCGELLVRLLEQAGVNTVFGIPGVHTIELYRALHASGIRHVTPRHEQGAGFMADGYARLTGRPGVCFVITGPGMTNILTAMGQAFADSIPMLVISSVNRASEIGKGEGRLHELRSQRDMAAGVAAFSHTLRSPCELSEVLSRAFAVFESARPRPVHIEIPLDVITEPAGCSPSSLDPAPLPPMPDTDAIEQAARLLGSAEQPMIFFGGGCVDASAEAVALAETLDAPACCTINAKGVLPKGHPLSLGSNQSLTPVREMVLHSDVVLAIGTELGETDYDVFFDGKFRIGGKLIRIDIEAEQLQRNCLAELPILGDAGAAMRALITALGGAKPSVAHSPGRERAANLRKQIDADWPGVWLTVRQLLNLVQETLRNVVIVGDSTQPVYIGNHLYDAVRPRSWFNSTTGYGTLGYALPAAIGAKIAAPDLPVVSLIGDGGLQFTLPELASAVEASTPIIILLWNNEGYKEIKRCMLDHHIEPIGVDIYTPDFLTIAEGFGCCAERATDLGQLRKQLKAAARSARPTLIEIREDAHFLQETRP